MDGEGCPSAHYMLIAKLKCLKCICDVVHIADGKKCTETDTNSPWLHYN